jgi:hypothetical protein
LSKSLGRGCSEQYIDSAGDDGWTLSTLANYRSSASIDVNRLGHLSSSSLHLPFFRIDGARCSVATAVPHYRLPSKNTSGQHWGIQSRVMECTMMPPNFLHYAFTDVRCLSREAYLIPTLLYIDRFDEACGSLGLSSLLWTLVAHLTTTQYWGSRLQAKLPEGNQPVPQ